MTKPIGFIIQPYCAELPRNDPYGAFERIGTKARARGAVAIAAHEFPNTMSAKWPKYVRAAKNAGLLAVAAWGEDSPSFTPEEKGRAIGTIARDPDCAASLVDAEGYWDAKHEHDALTLGEALRHEAGQDALVGDQCWFAIDSHGSVRAVAKPIDEGGVYEGFPVDEFAAKAVNWYRLRQLYANEAGFKAQWGDARFEHCEAWMIRDWTAADPVLTLAGLHRPVGVSLQGYGGWRLRDLTYALLKYSVEFPGPLPIWCEKHGQSLPEPDPDVWAAIEFVRFLVNRGFAGAGVTPHDAVLAFQRDYNKTSTFKIDEDGWGGSKTWAAAGIVPAP